MSSCYDRVKVIDPLTNEQIDGLLGVLTKVGIYPKKFIRMGMNGVSFPSCYSTFSLSKCNSQLRDEIKAFLPERLFNESVLQYFLSFPAYAGRLDGQDCWMDTSKPMAVIAWSLNDNNGLFISERFKGTESNEEMYCQGNVVKETSRTYYASSLTARYVDKQQVTSVQRSPTFLPVKAGQGIVFGLNLFHEVRQQVNSRHWFCLALPPGVADELYV